MVEACAQATERLTIDQSCPARLIQSRNHPISQSSTRDGFTLIEMLVVMLIMGLFVGLVSTLTQPDDRARLGIEAERLSQLLDLAATKSRLSGNSIAWTSSGPDYRFWQFSDDTGWTAITDDETLRPRTLPQGMTIFALRIENTPLQEHMRLEFSPFGVTFSFRVEMMLGSARRAIEGSPIGEVRVLPDPGTGNG